MLSRFFFPTAMPTNEQPANLVIEFRGERAQFEGRENRERVARVLRTADELSGRAVIDRDRLKVRARL